MARQGTHIPIRISSRQDVFNHFPPTLIDLPPKLFNNDMALQGIPIPLRISSRQDVFNHLPSPFIEHPPELVSDDMIRVGPHSDANLFPTGHVQSPPACPYRASSCASQRRYGSKADPHFVSNLFPTRCIQSPPAHRYRAPSKKQRYYNCCFDVTTIK